MCIICAQYQLNKLTAQEAYKAAVEMVNTTEDEEDKEHYQEVLEKLDELLNYEG